MLMRGHFYCIGALAFELITQVLCNAFITEWLLFEGIITQQCYYVNNYLVIRGEKMAFYRRIRDLREDSDFTQNYVASYLGMKQPQYYRYECGYRDVPTDVLIALAKLYNTSTDYILGLTDKK